MFLTYNISKGNKYKFRLSLNQDVLCLYNEVAISILLSLVSNLEIPHRGRSIVTDPSTAWFKGGGTCPIYHQAGIFDKYDK